MIRILLVDHFLPPPRFPLPRQQHVLQLRTLPVLIPSLLLVLLCLLAVVLLFPLVLSDRFLLSIPSSLLVPSLSLESLPGGKEGVSPHLPQAR